MAALDLQRLRCFLAVAEEKHFARAAARLNMTPPPLSRQIKQLEREINGDLFVRGYHDVELTPLGEALLVPVREALAGVDAVWDVAEVLRGRTAPLRIDATPYAPTPILDEFLSLLRDSGIDQEDEIALDSGSLGLAKRVAAGTVDLALAHLPSPDDSLSALHFRDYRLAVAVRNDDPLAARASLTLEELRGRTIVHPLGQLHPGVLEAHRAVFEKAGIAAQLDTVGPVGAAENATRVWSRRLVSFVPDVPGTLLGRVFAAPDFATIPLVGDDLTMSLGVIWNSTSEVPNSPLRRALSLFDSARITSTTN